ncbi:MAG: hypothetical protein FWD64_01505 [Acidobacteriaceae bacterium]|nr:hypothetical protein [Acidobacteriaceae bacterium]
MGFLTAIFFTIGLLVYVFWPVKNPFVQPAKTRADYLRERKEAIDANLRDLNFEYQAGKYPDEDYLRQKADLENEASRVSTELEEPSLK